ncbi:MAG: RHS repeat-associated core domain-containing protein [Verrucomicrobiae bacterium]|nr:RHS repeat-associated core domain-containing protein [Verrucomicrobiae bacterium]
MSNTARRTSMTYPNGRVVNLGYGSSDSIDDLFGLVKSAAISGEGGNKVEYSRAGLGRFVKVAYPQPGVEMSMIRPGGGSEGDSGDPYDGYDHFGRVQEMRWQNSSTGTPIDAWQWGYNEASNRTWKKNLVAASGQDESYGYDGLYQVIRDAVGTLNTNRTTVGGVPGETEDFEYDPTGNWLGYRKNANGSVVLDQSRSNNQDNQLTQIDGSSALLSYDRAGNATKLPPGESVNGEPFLNVIWDAWNRIVRVETEGDDWIHLVGEYSYDGLSRRITRTVDEVTTHTYWGDRWKPMEERVGSATSAARSYLWGERPGHRDELVLRDRDTDGNGTLDERLYATMDYFNGISVLNTSGTVLERYAYSAFGVRRIMASDFSPRPTSGYAWDFGFQGQFRDGETGWYNYGYRFYVPMLGRWINRDPIGERGGLNLYRYGGNGGVNDLDYLGLTCEEDGPPFWKTSDGKWELEIDPVSQGGKPQRGTQIIAIEKVIFKWTTTTEIKCICDGKICYRSGQRQYEYEYEVPTEDENWAIPSVGTDLPLPTGFADLLGDKIGDAVKMTKPFAPSESLAGRLGEIMRKLGPKAPAEGEWSGGSPCDS